MDFVHGLRGVINSASISFLFFALFIHNYCCRSVVYSVVCIWCIFCKRNCKSSSIDSYQCSFSVEFTRLYFSEICSRAFITHTLHCWLFLLCSFGRQMSLRLIHPRLFGEFRVYVISRFVVLTGRPAGTLAGFSTSCLI